MGSAPAPPAAPNPVTTAAAQTGENVDTAIANAALNNVNQTDAYGDKQTFSTNGDTHMTDPLTGQTYQIPQYSESTTLSPAEQGIYNTTQQIQQQNANTGLQQSQAVAGDLSQPVNLSNVNQSYINPAGMPEANLSASNVNNFINTQWEQPLAYEQGNEQEQLNQGLADQGINLNDPAYKQAQINEGQNFQQQQDTYANNMYGTASSNILGATSLEDQNLLNSTQANNTAALNEGNFNNQTALTRQNQPINAIDALLSSSQVNQPTFTNTQQPTIPTTDYSQIAQNSYQDQLQSYNAQVQAQAAQTGGLFGLGGAVAGGLLKSPLIGGIL